MTARQRKLKQAQIILADLGMPTAQQNERSALCLLALLDMTPKKAWFEATSPTMGVTPIMDWAKAHYAASYAPNTRETFRRRSLHQFVQAGVCLYNPDQADRPVNSPKAAYQMAPPLLAVLQTFGTAAYQGQLAAYVKTRTPLAHQYAKARQMAMVPVQSPAGHQLALSPGKHSALIKSVIEQFAPRYAPNGELAYVGDTGNKGGLFDKLLLAELGLRLDGHGKLPDVVIYMRDKNWLLLIEAVTSHGPVDAKRQVELAQLLAGCKAGLIYVSAFPDRKTFLKHLGAIAWESEVWIADAPTHMVHFNGTRFLGPYGD